MAAGWPSLLVRYLLVLGLDSTSYGITNFIWKVTGKTYESIVLTMVNLASVVILIKN
jgi:hypothetical protein